ncbi:hypothetical protein LV779_17960 [Streptomyces thinghirensis]|nr:hypothetical protein [Streptomyces thinghirensis]
MSDSQLWDDIDAYFTTHLAPGDRRALEAALRKSDATGLPRLNVTANQGEVPPAPRARIRGARPSWRSAPSAATAPSWLARALPADGRLVTLEYSARHAEVATRSIARAGLDALVDVRVGPALGRCRSSPTTTRRPST